MVSCAIQTAPASPREPPLGPSLGFIKKSAPSDEETPLVCVQEAKSIPMDDICPVLSPSVIPMVSHESYATSGMTAINAGLTPARSDPNGASAWNAGGMVNAVPEPEDMAYTLSS